MAKKKTGGWAELQSGSRDFRILLSHFLLSILIFCPRSAAQKIQIAEIVPLIPIPALTSGNITYVRGLPPSESSIGSFMHIQDVDTSAAQTKIQLRFFKTNFERNFYDGSVIDKVFTTSGQYSRISEAFYNPSYSPPSLILNDSFIESASASKDRIISWPISINPTSQQVTDGPGQITEVSTTSTPRKIVQNSDGKLYFARIEGSNTFVLEELSAISPGDPATVMKVTLPSGIIGIFQIELVFRIGDFLIIVIRDKTIIYGDVTKFSSTQTCTNAEHCGFMSRQYYITFARIDMSKDCTMTSCILMGIDGSYLDIYRINLSTKTTTVLHSPFVGQATLGFIQLGNQREVLVTSASAMQVYRLAATFPATSEPPVLLLTSTEVSIDSSLGSNTTALNGFVIKQVATVEAVSEPMQRVAIMLLVQETNSIMFKLKMVSFGWEGCYSRNAQGNCICSPGYGYAKGKCLKCNHGTTCRKECMEFQGVCLKCPGVIGSTSNPFVITDTEETGYECRFGDDANSVIGYGRDKSEPKPKWASCTIANCANCQADHTKCTVCKPKNLLYDGNCLACPLSTPDDLSTAIAITAVATLTPFQCKQSTDPNYSMGYGRDFTQPAPFWARCTAKDCTNCQADHTKCTECVSTCVLYSNLCLKNAASLGTGQANLISSDATEVVTLGTGNYVSYGKDLSAPTPVARKCLSGCSLCIEDYLICTSCENTHILYDGRCYFCGNPSIQTTNRVLVRESTAGQLQCQDKTAAAYSSGYGPISLDQTIVWQRCRSTNCADCSDLSSICKQCTAKYLPYNGDCLTCPISVLDDLTNAIAVLVNANSQSFECKLNTDSTYSVGYGRDFTQPAPSWAPCVINHCADCQDDHSQCISCKPKHFLYRGYCLACPSNTPDDFSTAIIILKASNSLHFECQLSTDPTYSTGYGRDLIQPAPFWGTCATDNCADCQTDRTLCQECRASHLSFGQFCLPCQSAGFSQSMVILSLDGASYECHPLDTPPYNQVYGRDHTQLDRFFAPCTVESCTYCRDDRTICTQCSADTLLLSNRCILCQQNNIPDEDKVALLQLGQPGDPPQLICVDKTLPEFANIGPILTFEGQEYAYCHDTGCSDCSADYLVCKTCKPEYQLIDRSCFACDLRVSTNVVVRKFDSLQCLSTTNPASIVGFGQGRSQTSQYWLPCSDNKCIDCVADSSKCNACAATYALHDNQCVRCDMAITNNAIIQVDAKYQCVDMLTPPFSYGYGLDVNITSHRFLRPCNIDNCISCAPDHVSCYGCRDTYALTFSAGCLRCEPVPDNSKSTPIADSFIRRVPTENQLIIAFPPEQSRQITSMAALDAKTGDTYSCEDLRCKYEFKDDLLELSFNSPVTITKGQLTLYRKSSVPAILNSIVNNRKLRVLQSDETPIIIKNFVLMKTSWYSVWTTVFQAVFCVYRLFGSVLLFPRYPHLAMLADNVVNLSFVVSLLMGPLLPIADFALHIVSNVKILWYRVYNPFRLWDTPTLLCQTRPKHAEQGVLCSFLDNFGQDLLSLIILLVFFAAVGWVTRKCCATGQAGSKTKYVADLITKYFGMRYIVAKIDANHILIVMSSLISFDAADSTSKSVVGRIVAVMLLAGFLVYVFAVTKKALEKTEQSQQELPTETDRKLAYVETEGEALNTSTKVTKTSPQTKTIAAFTWTKVWVISFSDQNCQDPKLRWQAFSVFLKYLRTVSLCILTLNFLKEPLTQILVALFVQTAYIGYLAFTRAYTYRLELFSVLGNEIIFALYMILRAVSTSSDIKQDALQNVLGSFLAILLAIAVLLCLVYQSIGVFFKPPAKQDRTPRQAIDHQKVSLHVQKGDQEDDNLQNQYQHAVGMKNSDQQEIPMELCLPRNNNSHLSSEFDIGSFRAGEERRNERQTSNLNHQPETALNDPRMNEAHEMSQKPHSHQSMLVDIEIPEEQS